MKVKKKLKDKYMKYLNPAEVDALFDDRFSDLVAYEKFGKLKSFISSQRLNDLEAIREWAENSKKKAFDFPKSVLEPEEVESYNQALLDLSHHIEEIMKK